MPFTSEQKLQLWKTGESWSKLKADRLNEVITYAQELGEHVARIPHGEPPRNYFPEICLGRIVDPPTSDDIDFTDERYWVEIQRLPVTQLQYTILAPETEENEGLRGTFIATNVLEWNTSDHNVAVGTLVILFSVWNEGNADIPPQKIYYFMALCAVTDVYWQTPTLYKKTNCGTPEPIYTGETCPTPAAVPGASLNYLYSL